MLSRGSHLFQTSNPISHRKVDQAFPVMCLFQQYKSYFPELSENQPPGIFVRRFSFDQESFFHPSSGRARHLENGFSGRISFRSGKESLADEIFHRRRKSVTAPRVAFDGVVIKTGDAMSRSSLVVMWKVSDSELAKLVSFTSGIFQYYGIFSIRLTSSFTCSGSRPLCGQEFGKSLYRNIPSQIVLDRLHIWCKFQDRNVLIVKGKRPLIIMEV